jgi:ABC-type multidrug transport system, ATPase component
MNAVDGISLTVGDGESVGILGQNGAGKTMLLRSS